MTTAHPGGASATVTDAHEYPVPDDGTVDSEPTGAESGENMVSVPLYRARRRRGVGLLTTEPVPTPPPRPTVLARTLALAHRLQAMIDAGTAKDRADLAADLGFTRARITQIMSLLLLAPDIQEEIIWSVSPSGRDAITTRDVRSIVRVVPWAEQRRLWQALRSMGDAG